MAIFYHISTDLEHDGIFVPRIPDCRHPKEDGTTNRISVSTTISKCLTSIPSGGKNFEFLCNETRGYFMVMKIDTEKLRIKEEDIIDNNYLYKEGLVQDASFTEEHWITCPFTVPEEDMEIVRIYEWYYQSAHDIPYEILKKLESDENNEEYIKEYNEKLYVAEEIIELGYNSENMLKNETLELLFFINEYETQEVLEYLNNIPEIKVMNSTDFSINIKIIENVNLKSFFIFHKDISLDYS